MFCPDQSSELTNILWTNKFQGDNKNLPEGYIFACKIADFQKAANIPELLQYSTYQLLKGW